MEPYVQHNSRFLIKETYLSLTHTVSTFVILITEVVFSFERKLLAFSSHLDKLHDLHRQNMYTVPQNISL